LTPAGALYDLEGTSSAFGNLYEFKNGASELLGAAISPFKIAGNFALWSGNDGYLHLRNLATGTNSTISNNAASNDNDVAANGDVVFWSTAGPDPYNIYRYRNGSTTQIASGIYPKTDGNLIVYQRNSEMYLYNGINELLLSGIRNGASPPLDYLVVNGWVAFARLGSTNQGQIWLRSPSGVEEQITVFSAASKLVALAPTGEVIVANRGRLYLYKPGQSGLHDVASVNVWPKYLNGSWQYVVGRTLFR